MRRFWTSTIPFHFPMNRGEINKGERGPPARSSRKISLELSSQSQLDWNNIWVQILIPGFQVNYTADDRSAVFLWRSHGYTPKPRKNEWGKTETKQMLVKIITYPTVCLWRGCYIFRHKHKLILFNLST